uniref:Uncharacterized protein n=1 Tax=Pyramimonas obovata TaxID=1411642 RepID=A0A7S0QTJ5_9CHLO
MANAVQLLIGAGGIYGAFIYYGVLQEGIYNYVGKDGSKFNFTLFLLLLECSANVLVGLVGYLVTGGTKGLPQDMFALTGGTQIAAKFLTNAAMATGVSFPTQALAKSGKMIPVMIGGLVLGGRKYSMREYLQVAAIVGGTAIFNLAKGKGGGKSSSALGFLCLVGSLVCDGITGGCQDGLKEKARKKGLKAKPYDMMLWTNFYMMLYMLVASILTGEFFTGYSWTMANPSVLKDILYFSACSAVGQSFIFFVVSVFDPLVCTTITTTRKIGSVLSSILIYGHSMSMQRWFGVALAVVGILGELESKLFNSKSKKLPHAHPKPIHAA